MLAGELMEKIKQYFRYVYKMRYFWSYLVRCDLISRYRRSKLGMLWIIASPLMLTIIMSVVLGTVFKVPIVEYAPYILIGTVFWEFFSSSFIVGGGTFLSAVSYISQFNHPVTIYTLKTAIVVIVNYMIAFIGVFIWVLFTQPVNLILGLITFPLNLLLMFLLSWSITTISAFTNAKYRDFPQMMSIILQTLWYLSPVFFQENMFQSNKYLLALFNLNPITHMLYLTRKPLLYNQLPSIEDYLFTIGSIIILALIAVLVNKKYGKKVIFYL